MWVKPTMGLLPDTLIRGLQPCDGNAGNVFPTTDFKGNHTSRHVRDARAVMYAGIAKLWWRGKRSRHSRRMCNSQFYVSGKRPIGYRQ